MFAAFVLKILTVSHFPTEFGASPHNTTVSLGRCDLAYSTWTAQPVLAYRNQFCLPVRSLQDKSGFSLSGDFETAGFAAFVLKFLTVSHFPTEFGASPHNTTVSLGRCDLADSTQTTETVFEDRSPSRPGFTIQKFVRVRSGCIGTTVQVARCDATPRAGPVRQLIG